MGKMMRGLGYLISIVSVMLLGIVGWPGPDEPGWHIPVLLAGMLLSVFGMGMRWTASHRQSGELHRVERKVGAVRPAE